MKFNPAKAKLISPEQANGVWIAAAGRQLAVRRSDHKLPTHDDYRWLENAEPLLVAENGGSGYYTVSLPGDELPEHLKWHELRDCIHSLSKDEGAAVIRAVELNHWNREHRFCGVCGKPTEISNISGARVCLACDTEFFPRLSPAIIVRITRGNEILLAHNRNFTSKRYSCIGGFVEAGETLEECVHREVFEEIGVKINNLHYFGSQGWPFPYSLLAGFTAEYAGGEIRPDGEEIDDAKFFTLTNLPDLPQPGSISRALIDNFINSQTKL